MRFDMICEANEIEHRLTKPNHPWTNGQIERMNRTIKEATVKRFHYDSHDQLRTRLADFMAAYNCAPAQDAQRPHTLRIHHQNLDLGASPVHCQSDPPHAGTEHLGPSGPINELAACSLLVIRGSLAVSDDVRARRVAARRVLVVSRAFTKPHLDAAARCLCQAR